MTRQDKRKIKEAIMKVIDGFDEAYYPLSLEVIPDLTEFIQNHEKDISYGQNDWGLLRGVFIELECRLPSKEEK